MTYMDSDFKKIPSIHHKLAPEMNMPTRSRRTWMDNQMKDSLKGNSLNNYRRITVSTYDAENTNCLNKGRALQLANKPEIISRGTERILQRIQRHRRAPLHWSAHPQREQDETEKSSYGLDWLQKKAYDMVPQIRIKKNCFKMYKIPDDIINFIEKTMQT